MPVSAQQRLLRTLIAALKAVAAKYSVVLDGFQERTATDAAVRRAYKKGVRVTDIIWKLSGSLVL